MTSFVRFLALFVVLIHMWMGCGACCATEEHAGSHDAEQCHCTGTEHASAELSHEDVANHCCDGKKPCTCDHCCGCNFIVPGSLVNVIASDFDMSVFCADGLDLDSSSFTSRQTALAAFRDDAHQPPHHMPLPLYAQLQSYLL